MNLARTFLASRHSFARALPAGGLIAAPRTPCLALRAARRDFLAFARTVDFPLEDFQRKIARAIFTSSEKEKLVLLPRGNGKTTLMAAVATHALLTTKRPAVYCGAASAAQARILFEAARDFCQHPAIAPHVVIRALEIRRADGTGHLRLLPADGPRTHGLTPSMAICDELHAHRDGALYESLRSALVKRADATLITIATADVGADRPLSRLRARALAAPTVNRRSAMTECHGNGLRALLWEVPDDTPLDDIDAAAAVNPASWIRRQDLEDSRAALPDGAFGRLHMNARVRGEGSWLPAGAWQQCVGTPVFTPGDTIYIGVDVGASERSASAAVWISEERQVGCYIVHGEDGVLRIIERIEELAADYRIAAVYSDPWRFGQASLELRQRGIHCLDFPQTDMRLVPASQLLRDAITEQSLTLPPDRTLAEHAAAAVQSHSRRGWRISRPDRATPVDGIVALCMALQALEHRPEPAKLLAWI